jgi:ADP-ribose pyrophosphatase
MGSVVITLRVMKSAMRLWKTPSPPASPNAFPLAEREDYTTGLAILAALVFGSNLRSNEMDPEETLFAGQRFRVVRRMQTLPDGRQHGRDVILHPGAVTILPLMPPEHVLLIRNFRLAVQETLLELPAGTLEPGEDPQQTAYRELAEETGYRATSMQLVHRFWMSPGILQERMHLFVAEGLTSGSSRLEMGEQIEPLILPWPEVLELVRAGDIQDAKTLVGLLWYDRWMRKK